MTGKRNSYMTYAPFKLLQGDSGLRLAQVNTVPTTFAYALDSNFTALKNDGKDKKTAKGKAERLSRGHTARDRHCLVIHYHLQFWYSFTSNVDVGKGKP